MPSTIRDWNYHGVDLKVELATSGSLVLGANQTNFPFNTGGVNGAPAGWTAGEYPFPGNVGAYNFTTAQGVFSVSVKAQPTQDKSAGIVSQAFAVETGFRYQVGIEARKMDGKETSERTIAVNRSTDNGANWSSYISITGYALDDWEPILATGATLGATSKLLRFEIFGSGRYDDLGMWGTQFQNLYLTKLDTVPDPITWMDITCDVKSISYRYGREQFTNRYDVSTLQMDLVNNQGLYSYHSPHPIGLRPGRQVRITATYDGVTYPMAYHVIDSITDGYDIDGTVVSRWSCTDPTAILGQTNVSSPQASVLKAGDRIAYLLDQSGYAPRLLDKGVWLTQKIIASGRTLRDEAGITADSEGGNFFGDRSGNVVYKDRTWIDLDPNLKEVTAELLAYPDPTDPMPPVDAIPTQANAPLIPVKELTTDWSLARVINLVSLANAGGQAREYVVPDSVKAHGPHTYQRHDFVLYQDFFLDDRANDIMSGYSEPVLRVNTLSYSPGVAAGSIKQLQHTDAYLTPTVGTVSIPDPGLLPTKFTWVCKVIVPAITTQQYICAQMGTAGGTYACRFGIFSGAIYAQVTADGTSFVPGSPLATASAATAHGIVPGATVWLAAACDLDNGSNQMSFRGHYSWDGITWLPMSGAPVATPAMTAQYDSTAAFRVGAFGTSSAPFPGPIYYCEQRTGLVPNGGSITWRFDASEYPGTGTTYIDTRGRTWTLTSAAAITPETGPREAWLNSYAGTVQTDDKPAFAFPDTGVRFTFKVRPDFEVGSSGDRWLSGQWGGSAAVEQFFLATRGSNLVLAVYDTTGARSDYTVAVGLEQNALMQEGVTTWVRVDFIPPTTTGTTYARTYVSYDGVTWTKCSDRSWPKALVGIQDVSFGLTVGTYQVAHPSARWHGRIYMMQMEHLNAQGDPSLLAWRFDASEYPGTGSTYTDPRGIVWTVNGTNAIMPGVPSGNLPSNVWKWTLGGFLNWLVRVWYNHPIYNWGYAVAIHIQSIEHRITPTDWLTTLSVDLPESFIELEWVDNYGWDQGNWDEINWDQE